MYLRMLVTLNGPCQNNNVQNNNIITKRTRILYIIGQHTVELSTIEFNMNNGDVFLFGLIFFFYVGIIIKKRRMSLPISGVAEVTNLNTSDIGVQPNRFLAMTLASYSEAVSNPRILYDMRWVNCSLGTAGRITSFHSFRMLL